MKLENKYQGLLAESFKQHVPGWDTLSPLDPMKLLAHSLSQSLASIEKRQTRMVNTALQSLPSLFGFPEKSAKAPTGYFSVDVSPTMSETTTLPLGTRFSFKVGEGNIVVAAEPDSKLHPLTELSETRTESEIELKFRAKGLTSDITLHFAPDTEASGAPLLDFSLVVTDRKGSNAKTFSHKQLSLEDTTREHTRFGTLRFKPAAGHGVSFSETSGDYTLKLRYGSLPSGKYLLNVIVGRLSELNERARLGILTGEPWEEVALEGNVLEAPDELSLQYPDGTSRVVPRFEERLLSLHGEDRGEFDSGYFYHAGNHSLVFPGAHSLLGDFSGEMAVEAPWLEKLPAVDWIGENAELEQNPLPQWIAQILPLTLRSGSEERELSSDYLDRFYSALRLFAGAQNTGHGVYSEEIERQVLGADTDVRAAEVKVFAETKKVIVYLGFSKESSLEGAFPAAPTQRVATLLNRIVPLDYSWELAPFHETELQVGVELSVELSTKRIGVITEAGTKALLEDSLATCLGPRLVAPNESLSRGELTQRIQSILLGSPAGKQALRPEEIASLSLMILHTPSGSYVDTFARDTGEVFKASPKIQLSLKRSTREEMVPAKGVTKVPTKSRARVKEGRAHV